MDIKSFSYNVCAVCNTELTFSKELSHICSKTDHTYQTIGSTIYIDLFIDESPFNAVFLKLNNNIIEYFKINFNRTYTDLTPNLILNSKDFNELRSKINKLMILI